MLVSERHKFIFVHVQKTAGISIETVLLEHFPDLKRLSGRHGHATTGMAELRQATWDDYFSFAFVRNPWDRLVSWYSMIERATEALSQQEKESAAPFKSDLWNYAQQNSHDFESFLHNCTAVIFDLGCYKSFAYNQLDYLQAASGAMAVDFVGKFETLEADFQQICERIGLEKVQLPKLNKSKHAHYSQSYTKETRALVAERFARDIESFDYCFELESP